MDRDKEFYLCERKASIVLDKDYEMLEHKLSELNTE